MQKFGILLMHLSWILIIVGAGITRYIGNEGVMPIREGNSTNEYLSSDTYLVALVDGENNDGNPERKRLQKKLLLILMKKLLPLKKWQEKKMMKLKNTKKAMNILDIKHF